MSQEHRVLVPMRHPLGGIRTYLLYNVNHLASLGFQFTFLAPAGATFEAFKQDFRSHRDVKFLDAPTSNGRRPIVGAVFRALQSGDFELVHSQGLVTGVEAALANLAFRVPHVLTLHDVIVPQNDITGRFRKLKQNLAGLITSGIDAIVAVSDDCADNHLRRFSSWRRRRCNLVTIHNGIDIQRFLPTAPNSRERIDIRQTFGLPPSVALLGFFGRFMPQKGFPLLLDALQQLAGKGYRQSIRLLATNDLYGFGREYRNVIDNDTALSEMVILIDTVPKIDALLTQIDLLVMPSLWEACPLLPMEAMVLGVPVIGSDAIGLREVLRDTPSLAPVAGDARELAAAIEFAITHGRKSLAQSFVPDAIQRFSNDKSQKQLGDLYQTLLARGGTRSRWPAN